MTMKIKNKKNISKITIHVLILYFNSKFYISFLLNNVIHWVESSDCNQYSMSKKLGRISEILITERLLNSFKIHGNIVQFENLKR